LLPPIAVRWICHQYGIDEEDLHMVIRGHK
jgi:hypothetical protein